MKTKTRRKLHALRKGTDDNGGADDDERHLKGDPNTLRDRAARVYLPGYVIEKEQRLASQPK